MNRFIQLNGSGLMNEETENQVFMEEPKLFPIGTRYSVDKFGTLYEYGNILEGFGSHSYEYSIKQIEFNVMQEKRQIQLFCCDKEDFYITTKYIYFIAQCPYSMDIRERIAFEENSLYFANLNWNEYINKLLQYIFGNSKLKCIVSSTKYIKK